MAMKLETTFESGVVTAITTGTFSPEEAQRTFLQLLEALLIHRCAKVLFDGRAITGSPTTLERFEYAQFVAESIRDFVARGLSLSTRFAYVLHEPVLDPNRFGETVAVNRGALVKTFTNPDPALQWLRSDKSS